MSKRVLQTICQAECLAHHGSLALMQSMKVKLLAFAQAADQAGFRERIVDCSRDESPRRMLATCAPQLDCSLMRVAIDGEYKDWDAAIGEAREIAIIPPVSGG